MGTQPLPPQSQAKKFFAIAIASISVARWDYREIAGGKKKPFCIEYFLWSRRISEISSSANIT